MSFTKSEQLRNTVLEDGDQLSLEPAVLRQPDIISRAWMGQRQHSFTEFLPRFHGFSQVFLWRIEMPGLGVLADE